MPRGDSTRRLVHMVAIMLPCVASGNMFGGKVAVKWRYSFSKFISKFFIRLVLYDTNYILIYDHS